MWRSLDHYRVGSSIWSNRHDLTLAFHDHPSLGWAAKNGYDHHSRAPHGSHQAQFPQTLGGVMHLQWASWRRLKAKHARYKMDERIKYPEKSIAEIDQMYSLALDERHIELQQVPPEWWAPHYRYRHFIDLEDEPCGRRRNARHGFMRMGRRSLRGWISLELFESVANNMARHIPHGRLEAGDLINAAVVAQLEGKRRGYWAMFDLMRSDRIFGPDHHGKDRNTYKQLPLKERHCTSRTVPSILPSRVERAFEMPPFALSRGDPLAILGGLESR